MYSRNKAILILILLIILIIGCTGITKSRKKIDFYTLEYDSQEISNLDPLPITIRIEGFQVTPLYDSTKIIYSERPFTRGTYNYHKWHANPGDLVAYFLARDIKQSSLFKAVFSFGKSFESSHRILGVVDEFYEQDRNNSWEAVLTVSITLIDENESDISNKILFQNKYNAREECKEKTPMAVAEAMSRAMARVSRKIINDIYNNISGEMQK